MTLLSALRTVVDADPDAVVFLEPRGDAMDRISRRQLLETVYSLRAQLREHGVGEGDCVGVWLPNWWQTLAWQFAASSLGAHVIGINTRYNVTEVEHVLGRARPKVVVLAHGFVGLDLLSRLSQANGQGSGDDPYGWRIPQVVPVTGPGEADVPDVSEFDLGAGAWLVDGRPAADEADQPEAGGEHLAVAFTTSGSTGLPKLAAHDEASVELHALAAASATGMGPESVVVGALPFSGTFGFTTTMAAVLSGAVSLLHPAFDPVALPGLIEQYGVTHFGFGDDMTLRLIREAEQQNADLSSLQWVGQADFQGESRNNAAWLEEHAGAHCTALYGSSETYALLSMWGFDVPAPDRWAPGGELVTPGMELRIATGDAGTDVVTDGSEGEIQFRGPVVVRSYLGGDPDQMRRNFTADGWFRSGDLGRQAGERAFHFVCRAAEALRLRGFLVEPDEIAMHLATHPAVEIAKVVGVSGSEGDEAVGFVTLVDGGTTSEAELIDYCRRSLARFKVPAEVHIIEEMPVTAGTNGTKIKAATLKEWAIAHRSSPGSGA